METIKKGDLISLLLRSEILTSESLLSTSLKYIDVTDYDFDDQFPRPMNECILNYLRKSTSKESLGNIITQNGNHRLYVAGVARNYIGIRDISGSGAPELGFTTREDFYSVLQILALDLFLDYWLSIGDGFYLTKTALLEFPLHPVLIDETRSRLYRARSIWRMRKSKKRQNRMPDTTLYLLIFESL
ncbi:MAG: hypothetical protein OXC63_01255 [Aestuariivita sp.]|nr:hypothetical protein [Aestuariivita sp.]MCY4347486.1 hypothetical protein [Aestuariivita sp.]